MLRRESRVTIKPSKTIMDLIILGDTHGLHREVEVPTGDLLIFTGDFTMFSKSVRRSKTSTNGLGTFHTGGSWSCPAIMSSF